MIRALSVSLGFLAVGTLICGVSAVKARPQSQDQASASSSTSDNAPTPGKPKAKKVWTNDDMGGVTGTISVVGTPTPQRSARPQGSSISSFQEQATTKPGQNKGADTAKSVDAKTLAQLKQQLQKLQAGIDQMDKQIEQLKGASRGDSKNLGGLNADTWSYSTASIPDQIKSLEAKRNALQASMDNLLDVARASGIEPGQLR